jgi:endonuclease/exonuclease/phosphatase family metal-dependent hydrolase
MRRLRVATYNIHKCRGLDGRVRPGRIAEVLRQVDADIVALQEVLGLEDQGHYLARELGLHYATGENRKHAGSSYGNAVLSRWPLKNTRNYDVSVPRREPRGCMRTDVQLAGGPLLHIFNVHLGTAFLERRYQAGKLIEEQLLRSGELAGPRLLLGDFNEWTRGLVSRTLTAEFESADIRLHLRQRNTYPGVMPMMHLDHIYYDGELNLHAVTLHKTLTALVASDHLPLVADFTLSD